MICTKINVITGEVTIIDDGLPEPESQISIQEPTVEERLKASEDLINT